MKCRQFSSRFARNYTWRIVVITDKKEERMYFVKYIKSAYLHLKMIQMGV